ncbi:IgGFc-binding protein-like [Caenorhabditis elegans]|uniref:IgGFc-binding protein-like n=1 Tax=Caenorhabditis elegans TaxID=6239 RepID=G5EDT4_CAEEL|nr:IgGFc-binding protein-like [Caenorhabditis elegans]CAB03262.1 IgGFc-binding protein-like [Caenorhabditis elegans]|eukprot:NP_506394.1 Uncharacterized protein CELE_T01D3.6 [Caenorhabditis elegans]
MALFKHLALCLLLTLAAAEDDLKCYGADCEVPHYMDDTEQCSGLECESKETLLAMISHYQKEKHDEYLAPLTKPIRDESAVRNFLNEVAVTGDLAATVSPQCSICSQPGLCNSGQCVPDARFPWQYFYCVCPDYASGRFCQNEIKCKDNSCGKNADCYVANHQLNCICKPGYTARRNGRDCDMKVQQACMSGDPHYVTYDGLRFDYQGTCPYVFSQPCTTLPAPYLWYSVRAKNELPGKGYHISQVSEVEVDLHNLTIHVDGRSKTALVNGVQVLTPWYFPNKNTWTVRVRFSGSTFTIENDQGVVVTFTTYNSLCVQVPDIPEFNGATTLCGLAGNIDGKKLDDVVNKNGSVLAIKSSRQPENNNHADFMKTEDTWITDKFLILRPGQENCINGQTLDNNTNCVSTSISLAQSCADVATASQTCYPIQQAEMGLGTFGACQGLGNDTLEDFYYNCIYDICRNPAFKCTEFTYFLQYCQLALPQVAMNQNWRAQINCPLACPLNAHPSTCTSSCPSTCAEPFPEYCDQGCVDGCECDPGYVIDNTVTGSIKCIRLDQCGCVDSDGNAHRPGKPWVTQNCTIYHECQNGTMWSDYRPCSDDGSCVLNSIDMQCKCNNGYRGDGYNCTDINECVETPGICGHGQCVNTPGSYHCTCDDFWLGDNCNTYKPRRHCADLYVYWGVRESGVNSINPPFVLPQRAKFAPMNVYCDMTTNGGGYTLMSSDTADLNTNKTFQDYLIGFGNPATQSVWLGLEFIHQLTTYQPQNLRLNLFRCASNGRPSLTTDCTYPTFSVLDSTTQYSVVIREACTGSEADEHYYQDGWARWDLTQNGPKFSTWDIEAQTTIPPTLRAKMEGDAIYYTCSKSNFNTGWWYVEDQLCGAANLNGVRYTCPVIPVENERYLRWAEGTLGQSWMYLRPVGFPKYDTNM